jgi:hypothetical protein
MQFKVIRPVWIEKDGKPKKVKPLHEEGEPSVVSMKLEEASDLLKSGALQKVKK